MCLCIPPERGSPRVSRSLFSYLGEIFQAVEVVVFPRGGNMPPFPGGVPPVQPSEVLHPLSGLVDRLGQLLLAVNQLLVRQEITVIVSIVVVGGGGGGGGVGCSHAQKTRVCTVTDRRMYMRLGGW